MGETAPVLPTGRRLNEVIAILGLQCNHALDDGIAAAHAPNPFHEPLGVASVVKSSCAKNQIVGLRGLLEKHPDIVSNEYDALELKPSRNRLGAPDVLPVQLDPGNPRPGLQIIDVAAVIAVSTEQVETGRRRWQI
jgi:hypothetical protein